MDLNEPKHFFTPLLFRNIVSITERGRDVIVVPLLLLDEDDEEPRPEEDEVL